MPLSDDQRAMLRLLAQREEGYEDIAALMGLSVGEVRARVREALTALDDKESAPPPPPPAASPTPRSEPAEPEPAPEKREPSKRPPPPTRSGASRPQRLAMLVVGRRRLAELSGGVLILLLLALFVTGVVDIGGGSDNGNGNGDAVAATEAADGEGELIQAELAPVDDSEASGRAIFGRVDEGPVLQVQAEGLPPSGQGKSYAVWLFQSRQVALRVGAVRVGKEGGLAAQLPMPIDLLQFVANGSFSQVRISLVDDDAYGRQVARAKRKEDLPPYSGQTALAGAITGPGIEANGDGDD